MGLARLQGRVRQEFHQLQGIPLVMQRFDWPLCCGHWCEFIGTADQFDELVRRHVESAAWDRGPTSYRRNFAEQGSPESLREISLFLCHRCGKSGHIDPFTQCRSADAACALRRLPNPFTWKTGRIGHRAAALERRAAGIEAIAAAIEAMEAGMDQRQVGPVPGRAALIQRRLPMIQSEFGLIRAGADRIDRGSDQWDPGCR